MSGAFYPLYSEEAKAALARAKASRLNYGVQIMRAPDGTVLSIVGEAHLKLAGASEIGKALVSAFALRGVEGFPKDRVILGRALYVLINLPRIMLRALSFGLVKDSTIKDAHAAKHGTTFKLEGVSHVPFSLHAASVYLTAFFGLMFSTMLAVALSPLVPALVPVAAALTTLAVLFEMHMLLLVPAFLFRQYSFAWLIHPAIGILGARDATMAEGTVAMLRDNASKGSAREGAALVLLGRAHMKGYARELITKHGFSSVTDTL
jgi:hypothetical protein